MAFMLGRAKKIKGSDSPIRAIFAGDEAYSEYVGVEPYAVLSADLATIHILEVVADDSYLDVMDGVNNSPNDAETRARLLDVATAFDVEAAAWEKLGD